jgi:hypothetical protein
MGNEPIPAKLFVEEAADTDLVTGPAKWNAVPAAATSNAASKAAFIAQDCSFADGLFAPWDSCLD